MTFISPTYIRKADQQKSLQRNNCSFKNFSLFIMEIGSDLKPDIDLTSHMLFIVIRSAFTFHRST